MKEKENLAQAKWLLKILMALYVNEEEEKAVMANL